MPSGVTARSGKSDLNPPQPIDASHPVAAFDCGKLSLNDWLVRHAMQAQGSGSAKTFVVLRGQDESTRVAAYFSLAVGQFDTLEAPERVQIGRASCRERVLMPV